MSNLKYKKMTKLTKVEELKTKRFVIRKSLIGKNVVITFTNKKQEIVYRRRLDSQSSMLGNRYHRC